MLSRTPNSDGDDKDEVRVNWEMLGEVIAGVGLKFYVFTS